MRSPKITACLAKISPWVADQPVSYTHLDVYKRQAVEVSLRFSRSAASSYLILPLQSRTRVADPLPASGTTRWNRGAARSDSAEQATGLRSMLFGVKTTSGLRHALSACRRNK